MNFSEIIILILIIANIAISHRGFTNTAFFDGYKFEVDKILVNKDYIRLISSGFLHVGWSHLALNMLTLYLFSRNLIFEIGWIKFLIIYFASLVGGDLLSLFIHRNDADYSSVGASGAVSGIIFASIVLFPGMGVGLLFIPIHIPGWLFGILYILYSIYGIKSGKDNIGHDAHLGGAVVGMVVALLMIPEAISENYLIILALLIPSVFFIYFIIKKPQILLVDNYFFKTHQQNYSIDDKYNVEKVSQQKEVDRILDKINKSGIHSLTAKEKEILKRFS